MVVSRNDIKRKRKDSDTTLDTLPDSPKRTKVHAQRKFAQGSNVSSPVITPVKELDREKLKCNDVIPTTELLPIKRPNTEDFLTFLCFRGTPILPPNLHFFNTATNVNNQNAPSINSETIKQNESTTTTSPNVVQEENTERPFIAFGVRKRADPFISSKLEKKRRHALALQALRRKYQEQRMAKIRAVTIEKMSEGIKIKSKNLVRTRSVARREADTCQKRNIKVVTKRMKITTRTTVKRPILKQKMCLRSRGRFIARELTSPVKKRPMKPIKPLKVQLPKQESSSEFSSDDDQPLVKTLRKTNKTIKTSQKIVRKSTSTQKKTSLIRLTRSSQSSIRLETCVTQRPSRKTKEAAALYMELLGRKLVQDAEVDDDEASIDSYPELPNVRRTEQRENEMKATVRVHMVNKINTRNMAAAMKLKSAERIEDNITKLKNVKNTSNDSDNNSLKSCDKDTLEIEPKKVLRPRNDKSQTKINQAKVSKKEQNKNKTEQSFSDSDEEPLAKLTVQSKLSKSSKNKSISSPETKPPDKKSTTENTCSNDSKCSHGAKKDTQTITKALTSDDDEEKAFRGFVQPNSNVKQTNSHESKCVHSVTNIPTGGADLLCKDVGRRFGKGKVNMSTEQIEKWLKESALAGECSKKDLFDNKNEDDILKYDEKDICKVKNVPIIINCKSKSNPKKSIDLPKLDTHQRETTPLKAEKNSKKLQSEGDNIKSCIVAPIISTKTPVSNERKYIFQQRRSILNKDRKEISPNTKAFSPDNESSVYAFEADMEVPISTPFRSHVRRPSSTATSRSEDEASKQEEEERRKSHDGKFRLPAVVKPGIRNQGKQEMSLTLSNDDVNSASIAVQVNLNSETGFVDNNVSMECSTQTDAGDEDADGHLFYIPLKGARQTSTNQQIIQGVAVKLGTEVSDGVNQRVVMRAKLVTQTPDRLPLLSKQQKPLAQTTLMYPPVGTVQPTYRPKPLEPFKPIGKALPEPKISNEFQAHMDCKPTVPSSPSASSSSSAKIYKRTVKPRARSLDMCMPVNSMNFPNHNGPAQLVEAPTFHPSEKEFQDPMEFIEKIRSHAEKYGICRIIPPPNFKPECKVSDDMRFTAYNQYVHKMLHRWGPNLKELMAIKKYLKTQSITLTHPPWIGGMEIDLPRLYQTVQSLGGLKEVIEKKRWPKVAEGMKIPKSAQDRVTKLDDIYCKYLLPYDTLSPVEREKLFDDVETEWAKRESRSLHRSERNTNVSTNSNESDYESGDDELDECIVKGRNMALNAFYRIARNTMSMWFKSTEPTAQEVEQEFWKHVTSRQNHLCVHSGSIDSSGWGYGFACSKNSPFARHPWNLKIFTNNSGSILRSMGPIMGVTVPTLHVGMVFSACCWYRDPHGLPWIEYLHTGASKIWYGIPDSFSDLFHSTLTKLVPSYCRKKTLWLPSDTAMVPPSLLVKHGVSLCRTVQEPGQFIVVFPKAFTSSICSGYVVSESVYFAPSNWLLTAQNIFKDIRDSCEPSMFSLERLLLSVASDSRSNSDVLRQILPIMQELREREKCLRDKLESLGLKVSERRPLPECPNTKKKRKMQENDEEYECEICRTNLYLSLVTDSHEEGIYCLDHAIDHMKSKPDQLKYCKLLFTYDIQDLDNLFEKIRSNIETKVSLKKTTKLYGRAVVLK